MKRFIKKLGLFCVYTIIFLYIAFLIVPFALNPFISSYSKDISKLAEDTCGLKIKIEGLKLVTTPKLTAGVRIKEIGVNLPSGESVVAAENMQAKISLLPLLLKKVEADMFSIDYIDANLAVKPDGTFLIADYLPASDDNETKEQLTELPLGLKLSNRLPNVYIKEYLLSLTDLNSKKSYTLQGSNLKVTDFVLDKNIKFSAAGFAKLDKEPLFNFNIKVANYIMPNINLNDLVFVNGTSNNTPETSSPDEQFKISDIFKIFEGIKKNGLTADLTLDLTLTGKPDDISIKGYTNIEKISMLVNGNKLPDGHIRLKSGGKKTVADIAMFTSKDEETTISSLITHTKNPEIELNVKSKASVSNILEIVKNIAASFNINDIQTLTGTGNIDTDFSLRMNSKKLESSGYFKIPNSSIKYELYDILIDNINADIDFSDNIVDFKKVKFNIFSQPLNLYGKINTDAEADLHLIADKILIKGLLAAAGQIGLLRENDIYSGTVSMDAMIKGNLKKINPVVDLNIDNVYLKNKPTETTVKLSKAGIKISSDGKLYTGSIDTGLINVATPAAKFSIPKAKITLDEKDINIADTNLQMENSKISVTGKIKDYTTSAPSADISADGYILSNDMKGFLPAEIKNLISAKGSMPIALNVKGNEKAQAIKFQLLATPSGYFHIADLEAVKGKSLLINADVDLNGKNISIKDSTGVYATQSQTIQKNVSGTQIIKVSGSIPDYNKMQLKSLNISTLAEQQVSVPAFLGSKASAAMNITLNGDTLAPEIRGGVKFANVEIPTIKTKAKNIVLDFNKNINVDAPLITIDNSTMSAKAVVNSNFTRGIIIDNVDYKSNLFDSDTLISAMSGLPTNQTQSAAPADLGIIIRTGKASITKFKSGKIVATGVTGDINLKNNIFHIKNLAGDAFEGKIVGDISCNILNGNTDVAMKGDNLNALTAIEAAAAIPNALSGKLSFDAKLNLNAFASDFNALLKSVKGSVTFNVQNGHYLNIGTVDQFVLAGNIVSNTIMKAALLPIKKMPVVQSSSNFSSINGKVNLQNGIATLVPVKSSGKSVAYFVTGQYNILNGYTNVIVLGRMGADIVAVLGPLGQLSVSKLASYLPTFGAKTLTILSSLTSNPAMEKISEIPQLSGGNSNYKDFKVVFIGNIMSAASVKSFKWLSECDTSELENASLKGQMQTSINTIKQSGVNTVNDAKKTIDDTKNAVKTSAEDIKNQVQKTKESIEELKNLKNMFKPKASSTPSEAPSDTAPSATPVQPQQNSLPSEATGEPSAQ